MKHFLVILVFAIVIGESARADLTVKFYEFPAGVYVVLEGTINVSEYSDAEIFGLKTGVTDPGQGRIAFSGPGGSTESFRFVDRDGSTIAQFGSSTLKEPTSFFGDQFLITPNGVGFPDREGSVLEIFSVMVFAGENLSSLGVDVDGAPYEGSIGLDDTLTLSVELVQPTPEIGLIVDVEEFQRREVVLNSRIAKLKRTVRRLKRRAR